MTQDGCAIFRFLKSKNGMVRYRPIKCIYMISYKVTAPYLQKALSRWTLMYLSQTVYTFNSVMNKSSGFFFSPFFFLHSDLQICSDSQRETKEKMEDNNIYINVGFFCLFVSPVVSVNLKSA